MAQCVYSKKVPTQGNSTLLKSAKYLKNNTHIHADRSRPGMEVPEETDIGRRKFIPEGKVKIQKEKGKRLGKG